MKPTNYRTRALQSCDPRFALILGKIDRERAEQVPPPTAGDNAQPKSRKRGKRNRSHGAKGSE